MTDVQQADEAVRQQLRTFLTENFLYLHPGVELRDDDAFLQLGIVDSLGFMEIVQELEERYGIGVDIAEITEDNMGSIDALARFVERKRAA